MGNTLRIHQLCTNETNIEDKLDTFFERLLNRGHQQSTLLPIFLKAIDNAKAYLLRSEEESATIKGKKEEAYQNAGYTYISNTTQTTHHQKSFRVSGDDMFHPHPGSYL